MSDDRAQAEETFRLFDPDGDGLKLKDVGTVLRSLGLNPPAAMLQELTSSFSQKGVTALGFDDFQICVERARESDKSAGMASGDLDGLRNGLHHFLGGKKGMVRVADLVRIMKRMGDALTDEEAEDFLKDVKSNCTIKDGSVDFEEVRSWVLS